MSQSHLKDLVAMVKDADLKVVQHYSKPGRLCVEARAASTTSR